MRVASALVLWIAAMSTLQTIIFLGIAQFTYKYIPLLDLLKNTVESDSNRELAGRLLTDGTALLTAAVPAVRSVTVLCVEAEQHHVVAQLSKLTTTAQFTTDSTLKPMLSRLGEMMRGVNVMEMNETMHAFAVEVIPRLVELMTHVHNVW